MRKMNPNEMKMIEGGASFEAKQTCKGWNFDYRSYHSTPIEGTSMYSYADAVRDHNEKLAAHKSNVYYKNFNHSAKSLKA
ncbi:MAG: hypothetical protein UIJ88_07120 [Anaerovoracaceae bacterium]|nr:hypothetical protein [Anaerovoracaceae bacterium]